MALGKNLEKTKKKPVRKDAMGKKKNGSQIKVPGNQSNGDSKLQKINNDLKDQVGENNNKLMLIVFPVGDEEYAIPIDMVREVVKIPPIAPIPQVPKYIEGVANIRGNVFAILDLYKKIIQGQQQDKAGHNYVMVIQNEEFKIAVAVNRVPDTIVINGNDVDQSPVMIAQSTADESYIKGIVKLEERMIILINILEMIKAEEYVLA
jgi:purine-binding chemotaxis protein CheW